MKYIKLSIQKIDYLKTFYQDAFNKYLDKNYSVGIAVPEENNNSISPYSLDIIDKYHNLKNFDEMDSPSLVLDSNIEVTERDEEISYKINDTNKKSDFDLDRFKKDISGFFSRPNPNGKNTIQISVSTKDTGKDIFTTKD
jgi:hypothetical protein